MSTSEPVSTENKTVLFFLKNVNHDFTAVHHFLKKRGFEVIVATDVHAGLTRILKLDPPYIFLAWDHKNEGIRSLPKVIYQALTGQIVPFIMSTSRDQTIQLEASGFQSKLYPPLSGPAILRAIQKQAKKSQALDTLQKKTEAPQKRQSEMIQVKSLISDMTSQKPLYRGSLDSALLSDDDKHSAAAKSRGKLKMFIPQGSQKSGIYFPKQFKILSGPQKNNLDETFQSTVKPEILDILETYSDFAEYKPKLDSVTQIYVMVIQEPQWTGYLTVASESYLDPTSAQVILNNWIKQMIRVEKIDAAPDESEASDSIMFEVTIPKVDFMHFCSFKSELYKEIIFEDKKTCLGFFSFSPYNVMNSVDETYDYLEIPTEFLKPQTELPFEVSLFLPENKKFILYTRSGSLLDDTQVSRLKGRNIDLLYTGMEFELALLKYKAEFNLISLIESYSKGLEKTS